jgi:hypothetical protein
LNNRKGIAAYIIERKIGVTYKTAWRIMQQIRIAMRNEETEKQFEIFVEVDETYIGGKPRKPNAILDGDGNEVAKTRPPLKRGGGTKRIPAVDIKERSTTKVYVELMPPDEENKSLTGKQLLNAIKEVCREGTIIATDDFGGYKILDKKRRQKIYGHVTVNHSKGQYYAGNGIHTNRIENFWSILKRGIIGIYHHISVKHEA